MIRGLVIIASAAIWSLAFGAAMVTIIPLSAMGLGAIFDASLSFTSRVQGFGFLILGIITAAVLLIALTRLSRFITKASHAPY